MKRASQISGRIHAILELKEEPQKRLFGNEDVPGCGARRFSYESSCRLCAVMAMKSPLDLQIFEADYDQIGAGHGSFVGAL